MAENLIDPTEHLMLQTKKDFLKNCISGEKESRSMKTGLSISGMNRWAKDGESAVGEPGRRTGVMAEHLLAIPVQVLNWQLDTGWGWGARHTDGP